MAAVAALLAVLALGAGAAAPDSSRATLKVVVKDPLTLRGQGFGRLEAVRIDVRSGTAHVRRTVHADRAGTFTAAFPGFKLDGRTDLSVTAVGAQGHRASFSVHHVDSVSPS